MIRNIARLLSLLLVIMLVRFAWAAANEVHAVPSVDIRFEDFIGAERCGECHAKAYASWRNSTHARAGGPPRDNVLSQFDGRVLTFADATVSLEIAAGDRFLFHVDRPNQDRQTFKVAGFVGGGHMLGGGTQTAFARYSDGSWRLLPFDYSRHSDRWFCDTGGKKGWAPITKALSIEECRYWPPINNFSPNCGNCHSSQLDSRFDSQTNQEQPRFVSLAINCESCHGPGRRHVELMARPDHDSLIDIGLESLDLLDKQASVEVCFRCHALTTRLAPGYLPGKSLHEHYAVNFFRPGRRHVDGRGREFGYQEGHLYSDCYLSGSMTCVDCHAPHTLAYRDVDGFALPGKLDDGQCTDCHPAKLEHVEAHTGHRADSPGSRCVACHMPFLQHEAVGREIRFARSDHTIPIPRPAFDDSLGLETACTPCHADKSPAWQQAQVDEWHAQTKPHQPVVESLLTLQARGDAQTAMRLLSKKIEPHPAAQVDLLRDAGHLVGLPAVALSAEMKELLQHWMAQAEVDASALARAWLLAANALDMALLDQLPLAERRRTAQWLLIEESRALVNGGVRQMIPLLEKAIQLNPDDVEIRFRLAEAHRALGNLPDALKTLREVRAETLRNSVEQGVLLRQVCATLNDLVARGMPRNDAIRGLCSAPPVESAVPVLIE